jgi:hypothetical protein
MRFILPDRLAVPPIANHAVPYTKDIEPRAFCYDSGEGRGRFYASFWTAPVELTRRERYVLTTRKVRRVLHTPPV